MTVVAAGPEAALLALLVAGHLLGDFALQSERMAEGKRRRRYLVPHVGLVALTHLALIVPLFSWSIAGIVLVVALSHGLIDLIKARGSRERAHGLGAFLVDQVAHIAVLLLAWAVIVHWIGLPEPRLSETGLHIFVGAALVAGAFAFNATGGATLVSGVLALHAAGLEDDEGTPGSGRLIGILERTLGLILVLVGQWAAIMILVAAKSIARFDELKDRRFSEYYLIGTLTSLLIAVIVGLALLALIRPGLL